MQLDISFALLRQPIPGYNNCLSQGRTTVEIGMQLHPDLYSFHVIAIDEDEDLIYVAERGSEVMDEARRLLRTHARTLGIDIYAGERLLFRLHSNGEVRLPRTRRISCSPQA